MSEIKYAHVLIAAAKKDLSALRGMEDAGVFDDEIFGFHVQQAVEKSLKAWLTSLGEVYPHSHDLPPLLEALRSLGVNTQRFDGLVRYGPYAVLFRYSAVPFDEAPINRGEALEQVEALFAEVEQYLLKVDQMPEPPILRI